MDEAANFKWDELIQEMESKSPLLLRVLTTIAVRNDHRNKKKVGPAHYPVNRVLPAVLLSL